MDRLLSDEVKEEDRSKQEATTCSRELTVRETSYTTEWGQGRGQHVPMRCLGMMEGECLGQDPFMKLRQYVPQVSWKRGTINPFPDGKLRHPESGTMRKPPALTRVSSQNSVSPTLDPSQNPGSGARMIWRKINRKMMKRERELQKAGQAPGPPPSRNHRGRRRRAACFQPFPRNIPERAKRQMLGSLLH